MIVHVNALIYMQTKLLLNTENLKKKGEVLKEIYTIPLQIP